jgi:hypothetical protein
MSQFVALVAVFVGYGFAAWVYSWVLAVKASGNFA